MSGDPTSFRKEVKSLYFFFPRAGLATRVFSATRVDPLFVPLQKIPKASAGPGRGKKHLAPVQGALGREASGISSPPPPSEPPEKGVTRLPPFSHAQDHWRAGVCLRSIFDMHRPRGARGVFKKPTCRVSFGTPLRPKAFRLPAICFLRRGISERNARSWPPTERRVRKKPA
jgi:hypothetical protein